MSGINRGNRPARRRRFAKPSARRDRSRQLGAEKLEGRNLLATVVELGELLPSDGYALLSSVPQDRAGFSVSSAGDVNGDGYDDLLVGAPVDAGFPAGTGQAYLVYGSPTGRTEPLNLFDLDGQAGAIIFGLNAEDHAGYDVSAAGDVNGDGFHDFLIGSPAADRLTSGGILPGTGQAHLIFGGVDPPSVLGGFDGTQGVQYVGNAPFDRTGLSVGAAGDVNGDGYADIIVGGPAAPTVFPLVDGTGQAYLIYGKPNGFDGSVLVSLLSGAEGVQQFGLELGDRTGFSVSGIGDLNGDGFGDFAIGAPFADRPVSGGPLFGSGATYVVLGTDGSLPALHQLDGSNGFRLEGLRAFDRSGFEINAAGDLNGDGFDDFVIGAPADADFPVTPGEAYVVLGGSDAFSATVNLGDLDGSNGFVMHGIGGLDHAGFSVSGAGDVNGDGLDDLLVGAPFATVPDGSNSIVGAGESYLIFGRRAAFPVRFGLGDLADDEGVVLRGAAEFAYAGFSVSSAGDVNGDGFHDVVLGAPSDFGLSFLPGKSYVVYGRDFTATSPLTGDAANNLLVGDAGANAILGGAGNDTLRGAGGADVLLGGQGADSLEVTDLQFQRLDGGRGTDELILAAANLHLDLTAIPDNRLRGIEVLDITGTGNNQLTIGNVREVLNISDTSNRLVVRRDAGDVVHFDSNWINDRTETIDGLEYRVFRQGAAELWLLNLAPVVDLNGPAAGIDYATAFQEDQPRVVAVGAATTVSDEDPLASATVRLINPFDGQLETLSATSAHGITASYDSGSATLHLTGTASAADYTAVLRTLRYGNTSQSPDESDRTIEVVVSDGLRQSLAATSTVAVTAVNDAPQLDSAAVVVFSDVAEDALDPSGDDVRDILVAGSITDPDGSAVAAIAIIGANNTNGVWQYSAGASGWSDVGVATRASARLLGPQDRIRFVPAADFNGVASFQFLAWDQSTGIAGGLGDARVAGGTTSFSQAIDTATVVVTPVNDAPELDSSFAPQLPRVFRNESDPGGDTVAGIVVDGSITDPDGPASESIAIIDVDDSNGVWQHSLDGSSWSRIVASENAALLLGPSRRVRFIPSGGFFGIATVTIRAWDQSVGTDGTVADASVNGDTTPFSLDTDTVQVQVAEFDRPPTLDPIAGPIIFLPGTNSHQVPLTGISDGGDLVESLIVSATSSNPAILPNPVVVYNPAAGSGSMTLSPIPAGAGWSIVTVSVMEADGDIVSRLLDVSTGHNPLVWQNPRVLFDVNGDTFVAPGDVLAIVNELNSPQFGDPFGRLPNPPPAGSPPAFFDVTGDGFVTPGDALRLINFLNSAGSPEGEASTTTVASALSRAHSRPAIAGQHNKFQHNKFRHSKFQHDEAATTVPLGGVVEAAAPDRAGAVSAGRSELRDRVWAEWEVSLLPNLEEALQQLDG